MDESIAPEKLYILPMGGIPDSVIGAIREALSKTYGLDVILHDKVPLPVAALNMDRQQHLSFMVIEEIARVGLDGMVLGIAEEDLYAQGLNFVFGEADKERGVAVISTARLKKEFYGGSSDEGLLMQRAVKEAVHEVGHLLGLAHCPKSYCVMHFSITISHTDQKSAEPCQLCKRIYENVIRKA